MSKFLSRYLKMEFDVTSYEAQENGEPIQVLSHEALENIVHNLAPQELNLRYDYTDLLITDQHCVMRCTFQDAKGRRIQAIGETVPATLETDIARNYPAVMAAQRAFDRAAIRYFDFPGKVMSNTEGVDNNAVNNGETTVDVNAVAENHEDKPVDAPIAPPAPASQPKGEPTPKNAPVQNRSQTASGAAQKKDAPRTPPVNPGAMICDATQKYRGKNMTIAQVYEKDPGYIKWVVEQYEATSAHAIEVKEACAAYLKTVRGDK